MNCLKYNQCCSTDWLQRKHTHGLAIRCCVTVKTSSLPCSNSKFYCLILQVIRQLNSICAMKAGFQREETILDNCDKYITKHNSNLLGNRFECVPLGFWQVNTVIYWVNPNGVYQNTQKSKGEVIMKIKLHSKTFLSATILWIAMFSSEISGTVCSQVYHWQRISQRLMHTCEQCMANPLASSWETVWSRVTKSYATSQPAALNVHTPKHLNQV